MNEVENKEQIWDNYVEKFNSLSDILANFKVDTNLLNELIESYDRLPTNLTHNPR